VCHLDEAGFAMTLATTYSWGVRGRRLGVPYQAPHGRRVNAIGAVITHGPQAGRFVSQSWAVLRGRRTTRPRSTLEAKAARHGLTAAEVGPIDGERVVEFVWRLAGRPAGAPASWQRERPVVIVLDNYSVHTRGRVADTRTAWAQAGIELLHLPPYSPELSAIEPIWNDVKQHHLPTRSHEQVADLKHAVDAALAEKARLLAAQTMNHDRLPT
jgi:hypothetical protein